MRKSISLSTSPRKSVKSEESLETWSSSSLSTLAEDTTLIHDDGHIYPLSESDSDHQPPKMPQPRSLRREFQSEILGSASAKRLNVSLPEETGRKVTFQRPSKENGDKILTEESQSDDEQQEKKVKESGLSGMKKWKYPRNESFIVDLNNPVNPEPGARICEAGKSEQNLANSDDAGVYYPPKSPLRRQVEQQKTKNSPFWKENLPNIVGIMLFLLVLTILYLLLLVKIFEINTKVDQIFEKIEELKLDISNGTTTQGNNE